MNSRKTLTCNLFHLPQDIFRVIFQYLSVDDLMKGEEAFLNNQELLSLYRSSLEGFTLKEKIKNQEKDEDENEDEKDELISWIIDHKLLVDTLELCNLRDLETDLLSQLNSSLKSLTFLSPLSDPVIPQLGHFPSLITISFQIPNYFTHEKLISFFSLNPQLEIVKIEDMPHLSSEILPHISNSCPKIKTLSLSKNNWVDDETMSLLTQQRLFPNLKSLDIRETNVRNQEFLRQFIFSRPLLCGLYLPYDIKYSNDFLVFYLRQLIFPSILSRNNNNDLESHSLAIFSLLCLVSEGILDVGDDVINPEIFSVDILSHLYHKDCSLETLDDTTRVFADLSTFPSMIDSILQSQFIPFILDYSSPHDYIPNKHLAGLLFRCCNFREFFPLLVEKYRPDPDDLFWLFQLAVKDHYSLLTTKELQTIIPIVLNKLQNDDGVDICLEIISKIIEDPSSQHLVDPKTLLSSLKAIDNSNANNKRMRKCLKIFISLSEIYQELIESNLLPKAPT